MRSDICYRNLRLMRANSDVWCQNIRLTITKIKSDIWCQIFIFVKIKNFFQYQSFWISNLMQPIFQSFSIEHSAFSTTRIVLDHLFLPYNLMLLTSSSFTAPHTRHITPPFTHALTSKYHQIHFLCNSEHAPYHFFLYIAFQRSTSHSLAYKKHKQNFPF